ncbi:hypothetical protein N7532_002411 [Penicillium argentinense]|uniref:Uncharacterized protein n=1 Tax=Penicillium argentinense TaxID=1131581 RepID=A0A9W9G0A8_9EURO|nr:uncharacterized protein N7532_002411 [Penicillium argentinense]KAJ5109766.1 hypothetical protein N7532_002411 [Penicillium argentinense]
MCVSDHQGERSIKNPKNNGVQFSLPIRASESPPAPNPQLPLIIDICTTLPTVITERESRKSLGRLSDECHRHHITFSGGFVGGLNSQSCQNARLISFQPVPLTLISCKPYMQRFSVSRKLDETSLETSRYNIDPPNETGIGDFYIP